MVYQDRYPSYYVALTCAGLLCNRHEITGIVTEVGSKVINFRVGDRVGVGCLAATCLNCEFCNNDEENYCDQVQFTYGGIFWDGSITYGGYSEMLVANKRYMIRWKYKFMSVFFSILFLGIKLKLTPIELDLFIFIDVK